MKDKTQKVTMYIGNLGIPVYEIWQYNAKTDDWYVVGDCSDSLEYQAAFVELHNGKLL